MTASKLLYLKETLQRIAADHARACCHNVLLLLLMPLRLWPSRPPCLALRAEGPTVTAAQVRAGVVWHTHISTDMHMHTHKHTALPPPHPIHTCKRTIVKAATISAPRVQGAGATRHAETVASAEMVASAAAIGTYTAAAWLNVSSAMAAYTCTRQQSSGGQQ